MTDQKDILCFGELLIRLNAPGRERLLQSRRFDAYIGGAEANVAVALAQMGRRARFVSVVADNALGEGALGELRRYGVDTSACLRAKGRMGLYFMNVGAVRRPSEILYDRANSAFACASPDAIDWREVLKTASWLHVSGVTPALGANAAQAAILAVETAKEMNVGVSFDGNYRAQLWGAWDSDGPAILKRLLSSARFAFINERDIGLVLGNDYARRQNSARKAAFSDAFDAFPGLELIAATQRRQDSVDHHMLSAMVSTREGEWRSREYELVGVVDRIGAGDAFAAAVLHAASGGKDNQYTVEYAAAAAALKHSVPGDFFLANVADIEMAMSESGLDVRR